MNIIRARKILKKGVALTGGRNNQGCITNFNKGGGHKQLYRLVDLKQLGFFEGRVISIEYDPNRSAFIALMQRQYDGYFYYVLAPAGLVIGDLLVSNTLKKGPDLNNFYKQQGNRCLLKYIPINTFVYNIELYAQKGGQLVRSAGTCAKVLQHQQKHVKLKMPSGEHRLVFNGCSASIGRVSNIMFKNKKIKKAGQSRWLNRRPKVRGVAMNPVDHPHGGGEGKTSGGRHPVTPWGRLTKGKKTVLTSNRLVLKKK